MRESLLLSELLLRFGRGASRLFRINAGVAWAGTVVSQSKSTLILRNPHVFHGAPEGFADLIGWHTIEVTPEMVGRRLALFVAIEAKGTHGRMRKAQSDFRAAVQAAGGIAVVAWDQAAVASALESAARPLPALLRRPTEPL